MLELPPDVEDKIREKAAFHGQNVGDYLRLILDQPIDQSSRDFAGTTGRPRDHGSAGGTCRAFVRSRSGPAGGRAGIDRLHRA